MKWTKYTIRTTTEAEDIISAMLMELGVEGIEIENDLPPTDEEFEAMYIDVEPELMPDGENLLPEGESLVSFYLRFEDESSVEASPSGSSDTVDDSYTIHDKLWTQDEANELLAKISRELESIAQYSNIGAGSIECSESDEDDWRNNWKDYFQPQIMGSIVIKPSWSELDDIMQAEVEAGRISLIEMDPGTAFGTGSHETTRLCVNGLERYLKPGQKVLDIGAGSGILGLCALSMGAGMIMATELDPDCEHIIRDNLALNPELASDENFKIQIGNILDDVAIIEEAEKYGKYKIIVSNILAPVIIALAGEGQADRFAEPGTIIITSGIIDTRENEVIDAFNANPNWEVIGCEHLNEWVSVVARHI